jgi:hypothetical protein
MHSKGALKTMKYFITFALCLVTLNSCGNNDSIPSKIDLLSSSATAMAKAHQTGNAKQFIQAANRINDLTPSFWVSPDFKSRFSNEKVDLNFTTEFQEWLDTPGVNNTAYLNKFRYSLSTIQIHYWQVILSPKKPLDIQLIQEIMSDPYMSECLQNHFNLYAHVGQLD